MKKMRYFTYSMTEDQVKERYHKLSLAFHPDQNHSSDAGSEFIALKAEYDAMLAILPYLRDIKEHFKIKPTIVYQDVVREVPIQSPPPAPQINLDAIINSIPAILQQGTQLVKEAGKVVRQIKKRPKRV